ncbi:MAG: transposase [Phenylobacterium sp.]|uniref:transposase n=1 Tax=Phenylobacterium sp. TaxID=1871053 RepID=UPI00391F524C
MVVAGSYKGCLRSARPRRRAGPRAGKRKRYSAEFNAKVALEALNGDLTLPPVATKHSAHKAIIAAWRKRATEGLSGLFSGKSEARARSF